MPCLGMIKAFAVVLLIRLSLSFPTSTHEKVKPLLPRADGCFASTFGLTDFKTFSGSDTLPASISFRLSADDAPGAYSCMWNGGPGSTSPYFNDPVPCNMTDLPTFSFSYPEQGRLRVAEVEACSYPGQLHRSVADGSVALFCYPIFGGQTCMTPTGQASLDVNQREIVS
ncbi:hypothetical protein GJ744_002154 [Endocarpon pusillum]|uniref:AA1-like domain-containing protein n=1 Tax=Endocarpon pusillum TaxID=364733 RepID=A0A8H7DZ09_9EURO|nr:hypothetical protein GJ744_002154 [Endocarpon pusillum]